MRKTVALALGATCVLVSGCAHKSFDRARPDEFAVARQAPLVIPPDFALTPPTPGVARPQDNSAQAQTLDALFGGSAPRSVSESAAVDAAGGEEADPGIRSSAGDPKTNVVDKGATTRDIVAAPQDDGQDARTSTSPAPAAAPPRK